MTKTKKEIEAILWEADLMSIFYQIEDTLKMNMIRFSEDSFIEMAIEQFGVEYWAEREREHTGYKVSGDLKRAIMLIK